MVKKFALGLIAVGFLALGNDTQAATDNADNTPYDDGWTNGDNGGTGFDAWISLENTGGSQALSTTRQVDGARSFEIEAGGYGEGRPISSAISLGLYTLTGRFDLDNATAFSGFNLKTAAGTAFGSDANELLAFGLTPGSGNQAIGIFGATNQTIDFGHEIRGNVISFSLDFDTTAGTFTLTATDLTAGGSGSASGSLKSSGSPVSVLGFGNFNTGTDQNLIFDSIAINSQPIPTSAASRKFHGAADFSIPLPLTGTPGVECRRNTGADISGPNVGRDHEIILTFASAITSVGGASVTSNEMADTPTATFSVSSNVVTVYLHNIANAPRRLTIDLTNVSDGTNTNNVSVPMGVLLGDVNGTGIVTSGDTNLCKAQALQPVTEDNFRNDINASGAITTGDVNLIKQNALTQLP